MSRGGAVAARASRRRAATSPLSSASLRPTSVRSGPYAASVASPGCARRSVIVVVVAVSTPHISPTTSTSSAYCGECGECGVLLAASPLPSLEKGTRAEKWRSAGRSSAAPLLAVSASRCSASRAASSSSSSCALATCAVSKSDANASLRRLASSGVSVGCAKPWPPPDEMLIDGTIGRPEKASPLSTKASCTALGELSTTHGARPILSSITSPYRSASCAMRTCGGGPRPAALPSPMNGSEPKTGTDGAAGGVERRTMAAHVCCGLLFDASWSSATRTTGGRSSEKVPTGG
eukprot:scaffold76594_cov58-Phaeocystis_antarctica.AAC.2